MNWFVFIVAALAVFRVSELIVDDKIFAWFRKLFSKIKLVNDLVTCFYCCSVHLSLYATIYAYYLGYADSRHFFGYWMGLAGASVVIYRYIRPRS